MPVEGLPKTLEILMSSLLQENNVLSWQIYQDKSGNVNMKLRFTGDNVTHDQPPVSYRRKAPAQVKRDQARAQTFRATMAHKSPRNMSDCPERLTGVRTRRMAAAEETPEQMRSGLDNDTSDVPLDISVDRMDDTDASTILEMSDLCPTVSPYVPKCAPYPSTSSENTPPLPTSPPPMESPGSDTELTSDTTTVDSGAETDADDMSPEVGRCGCAQCDYGGVSTGSMDTCGGDHYRCLKCSVPNCVSCVCSRCYGFGGHRRHRRYLKLYKD